MCTRTSRRKSPLGSDQAQIVGVVDEALGELHLRPPGLPGLRHHGLISDGTVELEIRPAVTAVVPTDRLTGHPDPEPDLLDSGQVPHQPEQRQVRRRYAAPGQRLGIQVGAFQGQRQPLVAEEVHQHRALGIRRCVVDPGIIIRVDEHVRPAEPADRRRPHFTGSSAIDCLVAHRPVLPVTEWSRPIRPLSGPSLPHPAARGTPTPTATSAYGGTAC